jgi:hypothetical protein
MKTAMVLAALLIARTVLAQPGETAPSAPPTPAPAAPVADPAYGEAPERTVGSEDAGRRKYVVRYPPDRPHSNIVLLAALGGATLLFGGAGVYFHLQSRSAADDVSAKTDTGLPWTQDRQDTYDRSERDATIAGVLYGIGGALALTTAILYIVTEPELQETVMTPRVTATRDGAMFGGTWSF